MGDNQETVEGTPKWFLRRLIEIAVLLPIGILFAGVTASPGLLALWQFSEAGLAAGVIATVWVGAMVGSELVRGPSNDQEDQPDVSVDSQSQLLIVLFALVLTFSLSLSAHVLGVALISVAIAPIVPVWAVAILPVAISVLDIGVSQVTGGSLFAIGFLIAYVVLRLIEIAINADKGVVTGISKSIRYLVSPRQLTLPR